MTKQDWMERLQATGNPTAMRIMMAAMAFLDNASEKGVRETALACALEVTVQELKEAHRALVAAGLLVELGWLN